MDALDLIAKIKMDLSEYDKGLDEAKEKAETGGSAIGNAFGKIASGGFKVLTASIATAAAGVTALTTAAVNSFAEYQQLEGGVKKLYGNMGMSLEEYAESVGKSTDEVKDKYNQLEEAQNRVLENAKNAYKTSGMSMNTYMETATSFSAKLINDLGGDTVKAADLTDKAMQAISDNFNTFGGDISMIQGAFQGFAKGNYQMLDNLKLGYGGTKTEMERLIADANEYAESMGEASDLTIDSFADQIEAIQLIQEKQQIAGTTQREAATTIEGALNMTKAAWENLLTAMGNKEEDLSGYINTLVDSVSTLGKNLMPVVEQALTGVAQLVEELVPVLVERIPNLINEVLPQILEAGVNIVNALIDGITENKDSIINGVLDIVTMLVTSFSELYPKFIEVWYQLWTSLMTGLAEIAPDLIEAVENALLGMIDAILNNIEPLLNASIQLGMALADGLLQAIPDILDKIPEIIQKIADFLINNVDTIMNAAVELFGGILEAIPQIVGSLTSMLPQIITTIANTIAKAIPTIISAITGMIPLFVQAVIGILNAIIGALPNIIAALVDAIPTIVNSVVEAIVENVPVVLDAAITLFMALVDAIPEIITALTDSLPEIIDTITSTLIDNIDLILEAAVEMFMAIIDAIPEIIDSLAENLPEIITSIVEALVSSAPQILAGAVTALGGILSAIGDIILDIPSKMGEIIDEIITAIGEWFSDIFDGAVEAFGAIFDGLVEGAKDIWDWITDLPTKLMEKLKEVWDGLVKIGKAIVDGIWEGIKKFFTSTVSDNFKAKLKEMQKEAKSELEINSPSKVFARIGSSIPEGLGVGIDKGFPKVLDEIDKYLDFDDVDATMGVNINSEDMNIAKTVTASATVKLSDADIDKIIKGLSITLYNTTEIDSVPIKQDIYKYTLDKMGDETRALQLAQGGGY